MLKSATKEYDKSANRRTRSLRKFLSKYNNLVDALYYENGKP